MKKLKKKWEENTQGILMIFIIIMANLIFSSVFIRWDLTEDKRYSLAEVSKQSMEDLEAPVFVSVYLEGEFPAKIKQFQEAIRTLLLELGQYSGADFEFEFVDPARQPELQEALAQRGYSPIPVRVKVSATEERQQLMYPIALMRYRDRELYVDLLKGSVYPNREVNFEKGEADLEYKVVSAIRGLTSEEQSIVAVLQGHGEISPEAFARNFGSELTNVHNLYKFDMSKQPGQSISPDIDVVMVLQPTEPFSERDKYELDQYLIRGGSILWVLNHEKVDLDLYERRSTLSQLYELNLDDMFMGYGFKINYDLIQDLQCERTELFQEGPSGGSFSTAPWIYYPMVYEFPEHPINRNAEAALLRYASSIDTFSQPGVRKQVFLQSSSQSRVQKGRQFIDLNTLISTPPPEALFRNQGNRIVGLSLDGIFESGFVGRENSEVLLSEQAPNPPTARFGARNNPAAPGKMVVLSDGNFLQSKSFRGKPSPFLPYDNQTILLNAIDYLAGDAALTSIRSREIVVRRLDKEKVTNYVLSVRLVNLVFPVLSIMLFGFWRHWKRRKEQQKPYSK